MDVRNRNNISLKEKLQQHYSKKKREGLGLTPRFLNRWAPVWYFVVICGVVYWGIFDALPSIYASSPLLLQLNVAFSCLIFLEVMVNWICIHYIDSSYQPAVHGTKPNESVTTENVVDSSKIDLEQNGFKIYVATSMPNIEGNVQRTEYPYWSWVPCLACQRLRPPRCHHCTLCNKCILKRDHHCYFARACVGIHNQRHFMVFLFWTFIGTIYSTIHMIPYFLYDIFPLMNYVEVIPPIALVRAVFGYQQYAISFLMFLAWGLLFFTFLSGDHFVRSMRLMLNSVTSFEQDHKIRLKDDRTINGKLRAVFGRYWVINYIIPLHTVFKPLEDPVLWPSIKMQ